MLNGDGGRRWWGGVDKVVVVAVGWLIQKHKAERGCRPKPETKPQ
jgi:hypothetical protein